jgi:hypothetical protein
MALEKGILVGGEWPDMADMHGPWQSVQRGEAVGKGEAKAYLYTESPVGASGTSSLDVLSISPDQHKLA